MTSSGGKNADGTIFKIATSGSSYTVLSHLNGAWQGNVPEDNLAVGKDSAYYGVTQYGGANDQGTIFKICGGVTTTLRSLSRTTDSSNPTGGIVKGKDGNLYGMTETGEKRSCQIRTNSSLGGVDNKTSLLIEQSFLIISDMSSIALGFTTK